MENAIKTSEFQYLRCFETHSKEIIGDLVINNVEDIEVLIRMCALNSRGVFIPDSDLNNNEIIQRAVSQKDQPGNAFLRGIETGFIRRTVRIDTQTNEPITQKKLLDDLRKSDAARAATVESEHPIRLDDLFSEAEKKYPPSTWQLEQVAKIFADRLQQNMNIVFNDSDQVSEVRDLAEAIFDYVDTHKSSRYRDLRGAKIVDDFLKDRKVNKNQGYLYQKLQDSYNSNVIYTFDDSPILTSHNGKLPDGFIFSPGASEDIRQAQYKMLDQSGNYQVSYQLVDSLTVPCFSINRRWLKEISFDQIVEVKEMTPFQNYYDLVYQSLQSPEKLFANQSSLMNSSINYWEKVFNKINGLGKVGDVKVSVGYLGLCTVELDNASVMAPIAGAAFVPNCGALVTMPINSLQDYFGSEVGSDPELVKMDSLFKYACFIPSMLKPSPQKN